MLLWQDAGCNDIGVELSQTLSVVFDPSLLTPSIGSTGNQGEYLTAVQWNSAD